MYFSDVYTDRRVPEKLVKDSILYSECLSGALYTNDFINIARNNGFLDPRLFEKQKFEIGNTEIKKKTGEINFYSATYRLFKIDDLETTPEDYGQKVNYKGSILNSKDKFKLDIHNEFITDKVTPVSGNTVRILSESRFKDHFDLIGNWDNHFGAFSPQITDSGPANFQPKPTSFCC